MATLQVPDVVVMVVVAVVVVNGVITVALVLEVVAPDSVPVVSIVYTYISVILSSSSR